MEICDSRTEFKNHWNRSKLTCIAPTLMTRCQSITLHRCVNVTAKSKVSGANPICDGVGRRGAGAGKAYRYVTES